MRKRRGNRGTWFPIVPTFSGEGSGIGVTWFHYTDIVQANEITSVATAVPLIPDTSSIPDDGNNLESLRDRVEGQTWVCERVVGKIVCNVRSQGTNSPPALICCAALAVLPVDVSDNGDQDTPELLNDDYQPLAAQNAYQPWLWRRTWVLGNPTDDETVRFEYLPTSNEYLGSVVDGPHVDTKGSRRMIQREQRLFLVTQIGTHDINLYAGSGGVQWTYDFRVFGRLVKAHNKSTFK